MLYGECFPEVAPLLTEATRIMSLRDPEQKMSKSAGEGHFLALDAPESESLKMIKRAVTDVGGPDAGGSMGPGVGNLFTILKALGEPALHEKLLADHEGGRLKYADLKGAVSEAVMDLVRTFQKRKEEFPLEAVRGILVEGAEKVRSRAQDKMHDVRERIGLARL
jgi:tryptophanyl-tRNA synthetase